MYTETVWLSNLFPGRNFKLKIKLFLCSHKSQWGSLWSLVIILFYNVKQVLSSMGICEEIFLY